LSPLPTFLLWRRMKLWELRSYEQVIKLEQERLVYQARLRSRFGRAWRRKAPVESLVPLRLARYGVPLTEIAQAGLAAAGIKEPMPVLVGHSPAANPMSRAPASAEHEWAGGAGGPTAAVTSHGNEGETSPDAEEAVSVPVDAPIGGPVEVVRLDLTADSHSSFPMAYAEYLSRFGVFPNAHQFALWLADPYGITEHGQPIPEKDLVPVVKELKRRREPPGERETNPSATELPQAGMTDLLGHPPTVTPGSSGGPSSTPAVALGAPLAEPVPTVPVVDRSAVASRLPRQTALDLMTGSAMSRTDGDATPRKTTVTDTGEATALVPEQQVVDRPVELTEVQRIERVVQWLIEAEESASKFSGAEAARRNQVSPKTGQRDVIKAREIMEKQRQRGRPHLRSVRSD
ncbi:hypothetical protein AB0N62_45820, partial [Streptomyces sp. NPDC093982]|uniref:hypothetical protein n=1 Tax=Streptomyces sp. NPDC093982 TaxID=3155077 RepID=UPI003430A54E